jgi:hypothetical protein
LGLRVGATLTPYKQEFFGSFLQKRTVSFLAVAGYTCKIISGLRSVATPTLERGQPERHEGYQARFVIQIA